MEQDESLSCDNGADGSNGVGSGDGRGGDGSGGGYGGEGGSGVVVVMVGLWWW